MLGYMSPAIQPADTPTAFICEALSLALSLINATNIMTWQYPVIYLFYIIFQCHVGFNGTVLPLIYTMADVAWVDDRNDCDDQESLRNRLSIKIGT